MKNTDYIIGVLLVAISAISFGLMPIFIKIAYAAGIGTYTLLFLRFFLAMIVMLLLLPFRKVKLPSKKEILIFFLLGAVGYVGQSLCYFLALNYASPGTVSLLFYTYPTLVMVGSAIVFKEKITIQKVASLCLASVGACIIIGGELDVRFFGTVFAIMAALCYSVYILISSRVVKAGEEMQSSVFIMLGASVVYGVVNLFVDFEPPADSKGFFAVAMIVLVSTVLAVGTFFIGMAKTGPSIAALVSILEPVVTVVSSVFILSEKITANLIVGGGLVLISLLITMSPLKVEQSE